MASNVAGEAKTDATSILRCQQFESSALSPTSCLFKAPASSGHNKQLPLLDVSKVITFRKRRHTVRKSKTLCDSLASDI